LRKKIALVQLALIDSMLDNGDKNHGVVEALNSREAQKDHLKQAVLKSRDPLMKLIWYTNFHPRPEEYDVEAELQQLVHSHRPNACSWP